MMKQSKRILSVLLALALALSTAACGAKPASSVSSAPVQASSAPASSSKATDAVEWKDPAFEKAIRTVLEKPTGDITRTELSNIYTLYIVGSEVVLINSSNDGGAKVTKTGYSYDGKDYTERGEIKRLDDIQNFTELTELFIYFNQVTDITALTACPQLIALGLSCNQVADVTPISTLTELEYLNLSDNPIADLLPLKSLANVQMLSINGSKIVDLTPIENWPALVSLDIRDTEIADISPLKTLPNLGRMNMSDTEKITDITPLVDVMSLGGVWAINTAVTDWSILDKLTQLYLTTEGSKDTGVTIKSVGCGRTAQSFSVGRNLDEIGKTVDSITFTAYINGESVQTKVTPITEAIKAQDNYFQLDLGEECETLYLVQMLCDFTGMRDAITAKLGDQSYDSSVYNFKGLLIANIRYTDGTTAEKREYGLGSCDGMYGYAMMD